MKKVILAIAILVSALTSCTKVVEAPGNYNNSNDSSYHSVNRPYTGH